MAIAISCYSGGVGVPSTKNFFFQSEHVSSQIWCQKFFPLLEGRGSLDKNFFSTLNIYEAKSGVKNFSLYYGGWGGSLDKKYFFPVWTCIKPILVSKNFPFTRGGSLNTKIFFPVWTCIKPNLVSKNFPFTRGGGGHPSTKIFFSSLNMYQAKSGVKNFSLYWDWGAPPPIQGWMSLPENLIPRTPPFPPFPLSKAGSAYLKIWDLGPPPPPSPLSKAGSAYPRIWDLGPPPSNVNRLKLLPPPILRMAGGKNPECLSSRFSFPFSDIFGIKNHQRVLWLGCLDMDIRVSLPRPKPRWLFLFYHTKIKYLGPNGLFVISGCQLGYPWQQSRLT